MTLRPLWVRRSTAMALATGVSSSRGARMSTNVATASTVAAAPASGTHPYTGAAYADLHGRRPPAFPGRRTHALTDSSAQACRPNDQVSQLPPDHKPSAVAETPRGLTRVAAANSPNASAGDW